MQGSVYTLQAFIPLLANFDKVTFNKHLQLQLLQASLSFLQLAFQAYCDDAEVRQATKVRGAYHPKSTVSAVSKLYLLCLSSGHDVSHQYMP